MTLRADVHAVLSGTTAVTALVGLRITRGSVPQGQAKPYIAYRKVGAPRLQYLGGPTGEEDARIEVACFGATQAEAESVAEAVRGAMSGWRNLALGVQRSDLVSEIDFYNEAVEAHQVSLDFEVMHRE